MAEETGKNGDGAKDEEGRPVAPAMRRVTFADLKRAAKEPEKRGVMQVSPEEIGVDGEELGLNPGDTIGLVFRPFKPNEESEIREIVKDFDEREWTDEYYKEIIIRCLEEPSLPDSAEGRKQLARWLPGTRAYLARAVQNQSGMGVHVIQNAKEALGKLLALPRSTSSNSGSARNTA